MRTYLRALTLLCAGAAPIGAQALPDLDASLRRLVADYTALYTRESLPRWKQLFLPTFTATSTTADGGTLVRTLDEFYSAQERGFSAAKRMGERLENVRIERRGSMATAWADYVYWYDDEERRGRLVLSAVHPREGWRFQSLMFSYHDPVGIFVSHSDVGRVRRPGSVAYDAQRQTYTIAGSGQNMWGERDDFHFLWKRLTGNFILSTRARFIGTGVEAHRKIGWTIRPSLETNSPHVSAALHGDGLMSLQFRRAAGGITEENKARDSLPDADAVIQLERRDGVYVMSVARFGDTLATQQLESVTLPDTVYVGLFVSAHNDTVTERATFSNVRITAPPKSGYVPYRDYIGSNLEILDVATGNATIVHQYGGSFQAPNWTADGKALIYAQEGRLYRFDLASRLAQTINTGFATRNNNDHVLSFDGRMMAISHHAVEDSGASIIYTVPAMGGTPKRVTAKGPSYFHGWSPDGRWLVYTGQRNDEFDVYKIPSSGGEEIRLTTTPGLDDGPEFTPDGRYIYFNSARTGRMQIWRMRPDGSGQQQVTNDGFNNWFPHISPDGKWIAYIAFPPEVPADDHPFYKHVLLRLMPIGGGPARVIAYVYGGQGTINVPSWSPDGRRLAFVSNTVLP
jgi:TolB protein